jgi:hypothetical protein
MNLEQEEEKLTEEISRLLYIEFEARNDFEPPEDDPRDYEEYIRDKRYELREQADVLADQLIVITSVLIRIHDNGPETETQLYNSEVNRLDIMKEIVNVCVNNKLNSDLLTRYASYGINTDALQLFNRLVQQNIQEDEDSSSDEDEE